MNPSSSSAPSCMMRIDDPIIQTILSKRIITENVNEADELERQNRMYHMLRHSKQYRRLSVERANETWDSFNSGSAVNLDSSIDSTEFQKAKVKVSFNEVVDYIPYDESESKVWMKNIKNVKKSLFKSLMYRKIDA